MRSTQTYVIIRIRLAWNRRHCTLRVCRHFLRQTVRTGLEWLPRPFIYFSSFSRVTLAVPVVLLRESKREGERGGGGDSRASLTIGFFVPQTPLSTKKLTQLRLTRSCTYSVLSASSVQKEQKPTRRIGTAQSARAVGCYRFTTHEHGVFPAAFSFFSSISFDTSFSS